MRAWEQKRARERLLSRVVPLNVARIHSVRSRFWVTACNPNFLFFIFLLFFKQYQSRPSSSASYSQGQSPRHTSSPLSPEPPVQRAGSAVRTNEGRTQSARSIGTQTWRVFI